MFVTERFKLEPAFVESLKEKPVPWGFGAFSAVVYYRTYSRTKEDGSQEQWCDTVQRVVEGVLSIRKDWYIKHGLRWEEERWQHIGQRMATYIFDMKMLPPGRGLWCMGTDYIYERGSMALNNCGFVDVKNDLAEAAGWAMNALMCGVGVGFSTQNATLTKSHKPNPNQIYLYEIPDSREGWVRSIELLIESYFQGKDTVTFDYTGLRPEGAPLKGFGGVSAGPGPLMKLHDRLRNYLGNYSNGHPNQTRLIADIMNAIGTCVVSGNIRRSAEIALGSVGDNTFLNLKNYDANPERSEIGWMSNNSVVLNHSDEFELLPSIANRVRDNGEPGVINMINVQKYGRVGKKKPDMASGMNPCAEIPLESFELCNLAEYYPSRCNSIKEIWEAMELCTIYSSSVSLLPTQDYRTNAVITRNRRIGISPSGVADWLDATNLSRVTMILRDGYEQHIEPLNSKLAAEAGIPPSVRLTTVKPSGTISLLAGVSPGMNWPVSNGYAIRRMRIAENHDLVPVLQRAGFFVEKDKYSDNTLCFNFPLIIGNGKTRSVSKVSIWEQVATVGMIQREWADNAVSNTLTFEKEEEGQIEHVIAAFAPVIKSISMFPASNSYEQAPNESINKETYDKMMAKLKPIDWGNIIGLDGKDEQFCDTDKCEIV